MLWRASSSSLCLRGKILIDETEVLERVAQAKKVILLEPPYIRKYLPLGLAKISTYARAHGAEVVFQREYTPCDEDLICITTLFTYHSAEVLKQLKRIYENLFSPKGSIIIGGIYSSLMPKHISDEFPKVHIFKGCSKQLDYILPDYETDWQLKEPWDTASYVFTTRGCPNKCPYCAVWRIEPEHFIIDNWREHIDLTRKNVLISDNNLSSFPFEHVIEVFEFIETKGLHVLFNNGFDCKYVTPELAELAARVKYFQNGFRLAFDRITDDGIFQDAVRLLQRHKIQKSALFAFVLFNFMDTPQEAMYRMEECIKLKIRQYPQVYMPLNIVNRENPFVGKHWTWNLVRGFRYFYLMGGLYRNCRFSEWIENAGDLEGYKHWEFTTEDKEKFYG